MGNIVSQKCKICDGGPKNTPIVLCLQCKQSFCRACLELHGRFRQTWDHVLERISHTKNESGVNRVSQRPIIEVMGNIDSSFRCCEICSRFQASVYFRDARAYICRHCFPEMEDVSAIRSRIMFLDGNEKYFIAHCQICESPGKMAANVMCVACKQFLCLKCLRVHNKFNELRRHAYIELQKDKLLAPPYGNNSVSCYFIDSFDTEIWFKNLKMVSVSDGRLIVLNKKLSEIRVYSAEYELILLHKPKEDVRDVVSYADDTIAVGFSDTVRFYEINDSITLQERKIPLSGSLLGLSGNENHIAIGLFSHETNKFQINIHDDTWEQRYHITSNCSQIFAMHPTENLIFTLVFKVGCMWINCVDYHGNIKWNLPSSAHAPFDTGIAVSDDWLLLSDSRLHSLCAVSTDGRNIGIITVDQEDSKKPNIETNGFKQILKLVSSLTEARRENDNKNNINSTCDNDALHFNNNFESDNAGNDDQNEAMRGSPQSSAGNTNENARPKADLDFTSNSTKLTMDSMESSVTGPELSNAILKTEEVESDVFFTKETERESRLGYTVCYQRRRNRILSSDRFGKINVFQLL